MWWEIFFAHGRWLFTDFDAFWGAKLRSSKLCPKIWDVMVVFSPDRVHATKNGRSSSKVKRFDSHSQNSYLLSDGFRISQKGAPNCYPIPKLAMLTLRISIVLLWTSLLCISGYVGKNFAVNCMKMREMGPGGGDVGGQKIKVISRLGEWVPGWYV